MLKITLTQVKSDASLNARSIKYYVIRFKFYFSYSHKVLRFVILSPPFHYTPIILRLRLIHIIIPFVLLDVNLFLSIADKYL